MMRPKKPRFCMVVVVMGAGVGTGVADGLGVAVVSNMLSCARRPVARSNA